MLDAEPLLLMMFVLLLLLPCCLMLCAMLPRDVDSRYYEAFDIFIWRHATIA